MVADDEDERLHIASLRRFDPDIVFDIIKSDLPPLLAELKAVRIHIDNIEIEPDV